jgi:putative transposase
MADSGIVCRMSRSGNVWDNAAFFSSLKTERTARKIIAPGTRPGRMCSTTSSGSAIRRHSTIGYLSPVEFERKVGLA